MAAIVALVRRRDFGADISSLSLFNFEDGFSLARDGWIQAVAGDDAEITEAMTLHVEGSSHDDLASKLRALDDKIQEVGWYGDAAERYGVWLRAQIPDEGGARQALITGMRCEPAVSFYAPPVAPGNFMREGYELALERMPWWEAVEHTTFGERSINCLGGMCDYTYSDPPGTIVGNVPARIALTTVSGASGGGSEPLAEFWLGFRTDRLGDRANFVSVWECESGSYSGSPHYDTALIDGVGGVDASGGAKLECTFATQAGMEPRVTVSVDEVTSNYSDQRGRYLILVRARVSDTGTTCRIRLLDGFTSADNWRTQSRHVVSSNDWQLFPMGTVAIPPSRGRFTSGFLGKFALRIEAERTAGSDNLELDCLVPIPMAEGFLYVDKGVVKYLAGDTNPVIVKIYPDGYSDGWAYTGGYPIKSVIVEPVQYRLPVGDGRLVLAAQRSAEHHLDDYIDLTFQIYERWRTLRGAQ